MFKSTPGPKRLEWSLLFPEHLKGLTRYFVDFPIYQKLTTITTNNSSWLRLEHSTLQEIKLILKLVKPIQSPSRDKGGEIKCGISHQV
jgi:hypothetical protein